MLTGRAALITGANQGLGKEIARAFLAHGAKVAIVARDERLLTAAAAELRAGAKNAQVLAVAGDVTDDARMGQLTAQVVREFGRFDILVNNAGVYGPKGWSEDVDLAEWRRAIDVNLFGTLIPTRHALTHFKKQRYGKIINLSGGGATAPMPQISAYAASKAAVVRLSETLALEAKPFGIDVNSIAPGALNTRLLDEVLSAGPDKVGRAFYERSLEQQRSGGASMENAAKLCVYLASAASDGVTGRLISAVWDHWQTLGERRGELEPTDIYTLRRITAKDRSRDWDKP